MVRYLILSSLLLSTIVSALIIRSVLTTSNLNGSNILDLGMIAVNLKYTTNTGINFGLVGDTAQSRQVLLAAVALIVCILVILWSVKSTHPFSILSGGLFAGGGLANAYERIAFGGVFDYLNVWNQFFENHFSFNVADMYIFIGLVIYVFSGKPNKR